MTWKRSVSGVEVLGRDAAARADEQMSDEDPVRMLRGVGQDHDPLARDRVLQDLAPPVHVGHVGIFPNPANARVRLASAVASARPWAR